MQDPVEWAEQVLKVHLWSRQRDILRSVFNNRKTTVRSGHATGKTFCAAIAVLAFLFLKRPSKVITTAPTWYQVSDLLWSEINHLVKTRIPVPVDILQTKLKIEADWFAIGLSPKEDVNFQGFHQKHILIVLDESPGVRRSVVDGAETLMSAGDAHELQIGNPVEASGHFYDTFIDPDYEKFHISCFDSPNFTGETVPDEIKAKLVTTAWVEDRRRKWGEDSPLWQARVKGDFPIASEDQLIALSWAEEATRREATSGERRLGVDVARFGSDLTVYSILQGNILREQIKESKKDTMHIAGRAKEIAEREGVSIISIDDVGVGGGVVDRLREQSVQVNPVGGGESAINSEKFFNRRTEIWWEMREWIKTVGQIPNDSDLIADLTAPKFSYTSKAQVKLESKEDLKKRLGRSPDLGDSLAIALSAQKRTPLEVIEWADSTKPLARASRMEF
jgi:hypothetical protein